LAKLLDEVRPGDIVVVWKLDRLGRSLKHLIETVNLLLQHDVGIKSLNDPIDATTPQGRLVFNLFASLAEFERDVIRERTQAGLSAARARGRTGGDARKGCRSKLNPPLALPKRCTAKASLAHSKLPSTCISPRARCMPICAIVEYRSACRGRVR
jgi:DNA invertase Pin-like site-specific DNA recombinase